MSRNPGIGARVAGALSARETIIFALVGGVVWLLLLALGIDLAHDPSFVALVAAVIFVVYFLARPFIRTDTPARVVRTLVLERRYLASTLHNKFAPTTFYVEDKEEAFYGRISALLLLAISRRRQAAEDNVVSIGIVGGPMVLNMARHIAKHRRLIPSGPYDDLRFVALNKAGEAESYQLSANFIATLLSSLFNGSKAIGYTFNEYDSHASTRSVDILLCSAGAAHHSYVARWLGQLRAWSLQRGHRIVPDLPNNYVGDFCLQPIDANGVLVGDPGLIEALRAGLDPAPSFETLTDVIALRRDLILPVHLSADGIAGRAGNRTGHGVTGKEAVVRAILRSGIVSDCVCDRVVARNLATAVGEYLFEAVSSHDSERPLRLCRAHHLVDGSELQLYVYDPCGRLDAVCEIDSLSGARPESVGLIPDVIVSEAYSELKEFNSANGSGRVTVRFGETRYQFEVYSGVRKPGQFSKITSQLAYESALAISQRRRAPIRMWDVGCGTGFVGLLVGKLLGDRIDSLDCSDISDDALNCLRVNQGALGLGPRIGRTFISDVVESPSTTVPYDLVVFNAPFLPEGLPENPVVDYGGRQGPELAVRFAQAVYAHLAPGGVAIVTTADYVDDGAVSFALSKMFGPENVRVRDRLILYPFVPQAGIDVAHEIKYRKIIEPKGSYRFEVCIFGEAHFLGFKMRHYIAERH